MHEDSERNKMRQNKAEMAVNSSRLPARFPTQLTAFMCLDANHALIREALDRCSSNACSCISAFADTGQLSYHQSFEAHIANLCLMVFWDTCSSGIGCITLSCTSKR